MLVDVQVLVVCGNFGSVFWGCRGHWLGIGVALVLACHRQGPVLLPWVIYRLGTNELIGEDPSVIISLDANQLM